LKNKKRDQQTLKELKDGAEGRADNIIKTHISTEWEPLEEIRAPRGPVKDFILKAQDKIQAIRQAIAQHMVDWAPAWATKAVGGRPADPTPDVTYHAGGSVTMVKGGKTWNAVGTFDSDLIHGSTKYATTSNFDTLPKSSDHLLLFESPEGDLAIVNLKKTAQTEHVHAPAEKTEAIVRISKELQRNEQGRVKALINHAKGKLDLLKEQTAQDQQTIDGLNNQIRTTSTRRGADVDSVEHDEHEGHHEVTRKLHHRKSHSGKNGVHVSVDVQL